MHTHAYAHIHIEACTHKGTQDTSTHTGTHPSMHTHIQAHTEMYTQAHIHTCTGTHTR